MYGTVRLLPGSLTVRPSECPISQRGKGKRLPFPSFEKRGELLNFEILWHFLSGSGNPIHHRSKKCMKKQFLPPFPEVLLSQKNCFTLLWMFFLIDLQIPNSMDSQSDILRQVGGDTPWHIYKRHVYWQLTGLFKQYNTKVLFSNLTVVALHSLRHNLL